MADEYATERENMPLYRPQLEFMLAALPQELGRVLDIGCAAGSEISSLRTKNFGVVAVDFSPGMLERAQRRFNDDPNVAFCQADAERLPFPAESFDHVVCLGLLEYLPTYDVAISEIYRVLRSGGLAVLTIPTRMSVFMIGKQIMSITIAPLWRALKRNLRSQPVATAKIPSHSRNLCVPWRFRRLLQKYRLRPEIDGYSAYTIYPLHRFPGLHIRVASVLQPLCSTPILRTGASVYMVVARK